MLTLLKRFAGNAVVLLVSFSITFLTVLFHVVCLPQLAKPRRYDSADDRRR